MTKPTMNLNSPDIPLSQLLFTSRRKQRKWRSRLLLETCKQLNKTHIYEGPLFLYITLPSVKQYVDFFFSSYSKLMLLVVLLSIHKYTLKYRVCARDIDKLDSLSSNHLFSHEKHQWAPLVGNVSMKANPGFKECIV